MRPRHVLFIAFATLAPLSAFGLAQEMAVPSAQIEIVPHRAVYKIGLSHIKNGSGISNVSGTMAFEWADVCEAWTNHQNMKLHFAYAEGDESDLSSLIASWESKDGKAYQFSVKHMTNGQETENFKGRAVKTLTGGSATYTVPKDKKPAALTRDDLFPSAHTLQLLQKAKAGEKMLMRRVFDGTDEVGSADVSAFIGARQEGPREGELDAALSGNALIKGQPAWPVRLAFYTPNEQGSEPDYEMELMLQPNGIARQITIDYPDFSVTGTLTSLEPLPPSPCAGKANR